LKKKRLASKRPGAKKGNKPPAGSRKAGGHQAPPQDDGAEWCASLTRLAAILAGEFAMSCVKQNIVGWKKWNPPFPAPVVNRYHLPACRAWIRDNYLPKTGTTDAQKTLFMRALEADAETTIDIARKTRVQAGVAEGTFMERSLAERTIAGALKKYDGFVRAQFERRGPAERKQKLELLDVPAAAVAAFYEYDLEWNKSAMDALRVRCEETAATDNIPRVQAPSAK
jgi:hypothetical protein